MIPNSKSSNSTGSLLDVFYPIGSIYETLNNEFNPNESWGGVWQKLREGQVLIDDGYTRESATPGHIALAGIGESVGEKWHNLTIDEMPLHTHTFTGSSVTTSSNGTHVHSFSNNISAVWGQASGYGNVNLGSTNNANRAGIGGIQPSVNHNHTVIAKGTISRTGGGIRFELTPRGLIVARWYRTA